MDPTDPTDPPPTPVAPSADRGVLRLLHVEDNAADAMLMQEYIRSACSQWDLSLAGASVASFRPEPMAVEFDTAGRMADVTPARAQAADCAILDLSLPDASGLEALVMLRTMSADLPIIVLTGFDDIEVGLAALRGGADDYLIKSRVDGSGLDRAVRYAIVRRSLSREHAVGLPALASRPDGDGYGGNGAIASLPLRAAEWAVAPGTHRVGVQIERATGEYALFCESCGWEAVRAPGELHTWTDRALDTVLLQHVTFGNSDGSAPV